MTPSTSELAQRHHKAADYFVRRREPGWTSADERELNAWLAAPANRVIFEDLGRTALDLQQIRRPALASDRPQAQPPSPSPQRRAAWRPGRRVLAPALLSMLMLAGGGWYWRDQRPTYELHVATGPQETRDIALPDGSSISLNVNSSLSVRYDPRRRATVLVDGEAFFHVAPDTSRPFTVDTGAAQVRVLGTAFNVRAAPPRLIVKVQEGQVQVRPEHARADAPSLLLTAGAGVSIDPATGQHAAVATSPDTVGDWRTGQLVFQHTPLADVAAELARYLGKPVTVEGERLGALPVSGMAMTSAPAAFLRSLPDLLPVRVDQAAGGGWRIAPRG